MFCKCDQEQCLQILEQLESETAAAELSIVEVTGREG
jgi:hypothetical protein